MGLGSWYVRCIVFTSFNAKAGFVKFMFTFIFVIFASTAVGQPEDLNSRDPRLNEGSLFTIQFSPGERKIRVSLAGKPGVELSSGKVMVFGREISGGKENRTLEIRPTGSQFEIVDQLPKGKAVEIEIRDIKDKNKKESFRIDLP
jgi:hypothetical protein